MKENSRMQSWETDVAALKQAHDQSYQIAKAHAKFFDGVVVRLKEAGIDLQPLFSQLQKDLAFLNDQTNKET